MKSLPGNITISNVNSNKPPYNWVSIGLVDGSSGCLMAQIELSYQQLGEALTGRGQVPCEFALWAVEKAGLKREHKVEDVFIPHKGYGGDAYKKAAAKAIKKLEVDGWIGDVDDANNHYHHVRNEEGGQVYRIGFVRYVQ